MKYILPWGKVFHFAQAENSHVSKRIKNILPFTFQLVDSAIQSKDGRDHKLYHIILRAWYVTISDEDKYIFFRNHNTNWLSLEYPSWLAMWKMWWPSIRCSFFICVVPRQNIVGMPDSGLKTRCLNTVRLSGRITIFCNHAWAIRFLSQCLDQIACVISPRKHHGKLTLETRERGLERGNRPLWTKILSRGGCANAPQRLAF